MQNKATNIINAQLATSYRNCRNRAAAIRKARCVLEREEVEVDYEQVNKASQPFDDAADFFRVQLEKAGMVEGRRMGEFIPKEMATAVA